MDQDEANRRLREQLGPVPSAANRDSAERMTAEEMREWVREAEHVEREEVGQARRVGLVTGTIVGMVLGVVGSLAVVGVNGFANERPVRVVERTVTRELPAPQTSEALYEARVPVCREDERAVGVGDYKGVMRGGWERWECVHVDEL